MDEDEGMERGDEVPHYPPIGSLEWERRLRKASADLMRAQVEIHEHCASINEAVRKIFRETAR